MTMLTAQNRRIVLAAVFLMVTGNLALFNKLLQIYPLKLENLPFLLSLTIFFTLATTLFLAVVCHGRAGRWILALILLAASQAAYYMDQYGVVIDATMIDNIAHTSPQEAAGLLSFSLVVRTLLFGILPAWLILKFPPSPQGLFAELKSRLVLLGALIVALVLVIAPFTASYASFIREHKTARFYANPTYFSISLAQYLNQQIRSTEVAMLKKTAADAAMIGPKTENELIILIVGETARADRFSLNGYARETNPELKKRGVVSFRDVASCATSTGDSVPCMFSDLTRAHFDRDKAKRSENVLDVLHRNHVEILWRDNNSDSKGVATRFMFEDFKSAKLNPVCDDECRDIGMLSGLDEFIAARKGKDILIVLHQMGNHGPEYYRRYTREFERFRPVCKSNELSACTKAEIDNAYDNAILYTDFFLSQVIDFLKKYDGQYETAMLYASDHGESLGEHGIYLHAAPYMIAPREQTHIPVILWMGQHFDFTLDQVQPYVDYPLSHDDLFCMLLIGYELDTEECQARKDVLLANLHLQANTGK